MYAGGALFGVGTQRANGLARWDTLTQTWTPLGNTTCASGDCIAEIHSISFDGNNMYVGGEFSQLGGVPANDLAKWDGSQWSAVGNFAKGPVDAIAVKDGLVYVGGAFDSIDEWNGQTWRRIGRLDGATNPHVNALVFWGDALYAGGLFSRVNQQAVGNLARWDGTTWTAPPGASEVFAIAPAGNRAFIAVSDAILQLKGSHLTQLGTGALVGFLDVAVGDNVVYRAGYAGLPIGLKGIEQWDGVQWQMLGSSVSPGPWNYDTAVQAIAAHGKDIYIGGMFSIVGDKPASNFAKWTNPAPTQPSLVAPKNKQEVKRQQPTLKWTGAAGATSYLVQLYADKRNGKLVLDTTVNGTQLQTPTLKPGKTYFWHVRACNANACGVWSNWRRFRVK
ncbi:MAG: fibronectin type III domain-containing protein [Chloroflexi bacterium]|nr:fibronectin type III domain-containing protein [Chloroflexota bacterium]